MEPIFVGAPPPLPPGGIDQAAMAAEEIEEAFGATGALEGAEILYSESWSSWEDSGILVVFRKDGRLLLAEDSDSCMACSHSDHYQWSPREVSEAEALAEMEAFEDAVVWAAEQMSG